jgi:hypothetical protein
MDAFPGVERARSGSRVRGVGNWGTGRLANRSTDIQAGRWWGTGGGPRRRSFLM